MLSLFLFVCIYQLQLLRECFFLSTLSSVLQNVALDEYLILGGDFNCTESDLDRNHVEPHVPSRQCLVQLKKKTHELIDIWRQLNGEQRQYTWSHVRGNTISLARLDKFYVFKHHGNIVESCSIIYMSFGS